MKVIMKNVYRVALEVSPLLNNQLDRIETYQ